MRLFEKKSRCLFATHLAVWLVILTTVAVYVARSDARREKLRADFSTFTLAASRVMFSGGDPYNKKQVLDHNYKYFPTNAILLYPFTKISVYAAQGIWFALNLGLLVWAFYSLRALLRGVRVPWWVYVLTLLVMFRIIMMNLRLGQWNTSVFSLSIIGMRYLLGQRRTAGSALVALAATLKFMPIIMLVYLLARRRWSDCAGVVVGLVFWIVILPVVILGPQRSVELMRQYRSDSAERITQMTEGREVSSVSVHSTIYRLVSPVQLELKGNIYQPNILDLSRETGAAIAKVISALFLAATALWLFAQYRRKDQANPLGELALISLCYATWFIAAPGVRHAQLISMIPLTFVIATALAQPQPRAQRLQITGLYVLIFVLYLLPSELADNTVYNQRLEAGGILALALLVHFGAGVFVYYKLGLGEATPPETADFLKDDSPAQAVACK